MVTSDDIQRDLRQLPSDRSARVVLADTVGNAARYEEILQASPLLEVIEVAETGPWALEAVALHRPDLVVVAEQLTDCPGLDVIRQLRDPDRHQTDVVLLTRSRDPEVVIAATRLGVISCLRQPVEANALRDRLEAWWVRLRSALRHRGPTLTQAEIDQILLSSRITLPSAPPAKGIVPQTRQIVAEVVQRAGRELSAADVARQCGLSAVATRRYLSHLVELRLVSVRAQYGGAGRPSRRYRWCGPADQ
jgi:two-component system CitB family response regulator